MIKTIASAITWSVFILYFGFWIVFSVEAYRKKQDMPWTLLIIPCALYFGRTNISIGIRGVGNIWINILLLITLYGIYKERKNLNFFFFNNCQLLKNIGLGTLIGILIGLLFSIFPATYFAKYFDGSISFFPEALAAIQGSIGEEILIRGFFMGFLKKYGISFWSTIVIQTIMFTLAHVFLYHENLLSLLVVLGFGFIAGYLTWKQNTIIPAITMHVIVNLMAIYNNYYIR